MKFRFKAFGLHVLGSTCLFLLAARRAVLRLVSLAGLVSGRRAQTIVLMMAGIDVVLGPLLTLVIANPNKPRRELARDIAIIVTCSWRPWVMA